MSGTLEAPDHLASGIAVDEFDPDIRPGDDLFRHVNGRWIARTEIPADKARYGAFHQLAEEAELAVREIVEAQSDAEPGTQGRKIADLYASFMDAERIEALGVTPLAELLARVDAVGSVEEIPVTIGALERLGVPGLLGYGLDGDPADPDHYVMHLVQGGTGLPDEAYYRDEQFESIRTAYRASLETIFGLLGLDDAETRAARVLALETAIAAHHWDQVRRRDIQAIYNRRSWAEVRELAPGVDLDGWIVALKAPDGAFADLVLHQPSFVEALPELLRPERLDEWRDWLRWGVVRAFAPYLNSAVAAAHFDFYGRTLTGAPEQRVRWKRGVSLVERALGEAVGKLYVERHFRPAAKDAMDGLVVYLIDAYRDSIRQLEWMTDATRERALEKLERFTPKIGYPVKWRDYSTLEISPDDLVGNVIAANLFAVRREFDKVGEPVDRDEWHMTPQTVNAYYNPSANEIVFPAAILQPPFFDETRDAAANFGGIGAVIGHEIGHGFDDQGSRWDGDGRIEDWWTEDDRTAFEQRTASLIAQYDALEPRGLEGHRVNGAFTIGENIGDLGGLGIAWKAYQRFLDGEEAPVIDGLTGAQRFFLSWAQVWRLKTRREEALRLLSTDPHSPDEFRTNQIVRNIDEFYEAFRVTEANALWLDPEERVTIW